MDDEDVLASDGGGDTNTGFAIAELFQITRGWLGAQALADGFGEQWMRRAGKYLYLAHTAGAVEITNRGVFTWINCPGRIEWALELIREK